MAYRDSDYTVVIAIMPWHKIKIIVLKLTLVVEIWALLSRRGRHYSSALFDLQVAVPFLGKAHEDSDHTPVIAVVHWRLHAKTHRAGEVASQCCNNVLSSFWSPLLAIDWAWVPHGMCVNWNVLRYATVATHVLMGTLRSSLYIAIMVLTWCVIIGTNWHMHLAWATV